MRMTRLPFVVTPVGMAHLSEKCRFTPTLEHIILRTTFEEENTLMAMIKINNAAEFLWL